MTGREVAFDVVVGGQYHVTFTLPPPTSTALNSGTNTAVTHANITRIIINNYSDGCSCAIFM